jgi:Uma2 family endonuclease
MSAMATDVPQYPAPFLPLDREWTVDDLESLPEDGLRYELVDGGLLVSPSPIPAHQRAARGLFRLLDRLCPPELEVFFAPLDFQPDRRTSLEPDLLVVRRDEVGEKNIQRPPVLVVEVFSPSTKRRDLLLKRSVYEEYGVPSYWMFDPDLPSVLVCERVDGRYREAASAIGTETVEVALPYPVRLCPAELAAG